MSFYEEAPRAAFTNRKILRAMLNESDIALLVFTGEIADADGSMHARDNVIHELGLFQGHLGFARVFVLLEEGVREPSNEQGVNQIRFPKGKLKEVYSKVVANIRRLRSAG